MITPQSVIAQFSILTGIRIRHVSHGQEAQAVAFCAAGFTLEELGAVVGYVQSQIRAGKLDERSLAWRNIFGTYGSGSEFDSFQDRLAMSQKTIRLRPAAREEAVTRNVGNGDTVTVIDFVKPDEPQVAGEVVAEQLRELRRSMGGSAA